MHNIHKCFYLGSQIVTYSASYQGTNQFRFRIHFKSTVGLSRVLHFRPKTIQKNLFRFQMIHVLTWWFHTNSNSTQFPHLTLTKKTLTFCTFSFMPLLISFTHLQILFTRLTVSLTVLDIYGSFTLLPVYAPCY